MKKRILISSSCATLRACILQKCQTFESKQTNSKCLCTNLTSNISSLRAFNEILKRDAVQKDFAVKMHSSFDAASFFNEVSKQIKG